MLKKISDKLIPILVIGAAVLISARLALGIIPILLAYLVSKPLSRMTKRWHGSIRTFVIILCILLILLIGVGIVGLLGYMIVQQASGLFDVMKDATAILDKASETITYEPLRALIPWVNDNLSKILSTIGTMATSAALSSAKAAAKGAVFALFFSLSLFYFSTYADQVENARKKVLQSIGDYLGFQDFDAVRTNAVKSVLQYLRAQLILMSITFVISVVLLGFYRVPYFPLVALGIAIIDAIPLLGPAMVYAPWIGITVLSGNIRLAILLGIAYAVTTVTRQVLEPRIVSGSFGINPLITITAMYLGYSFMGVIGLFAGALSTMVLVTILNINKGMQPVSHTDQLVK